jgi:hypothetical protein
LRELVLGPALSPDVLFEALSRAGPLRLELRGSRPIPRLPLLLAAARAEALLVVRFAGTLASPLSELALLAHAAEAAEGARLDLSGALLAPLVFRVGHERARRLLSNGPVLDAASVLPRFGGPAGRSASAIRLVSELLASSGSTRALLARERAAFELVMALPDRVEGIRAFRERRPPAFDW